MNLACFEIARAVLEQPAKIAGSELYFHCPRHDDRSPSLQINTAKRLLGLLPLQRFWKRVAIGRMAGRVRA